VLQEGLTLVQIEFNEAEELASKNPAIDLGAYQDNIASVLYTLAEVKQANSKYTEAIKLYRESLQLRRASDKMRPIGNKLNHVHCAMCMAGIGSVQLQMRESAEAFKIYSTAIHLAKKEELSDCHPIVSVNESI
jgi:tetratricopeptide (TPR) repeat protein